MDNEGFDPSTSRMLSVRSTNWASRPLNRLTQLLLVHHLLNCCNIYSVLKFFNIQHSDTFRFVSFLMFLSTFRRFIRLVAHQDWIRRNTMDVAQVLKLVFLNQCAKSLGFNRSRKGNSWMSDTFKCTSNIPNTLKHTS